MKLLISSTALTTLISSLALTQTGPLDWIDGPCPELTTHDHGLDIYLCKNPHWLKTSSTDCKTAFLTPDHCLDLDIEVSSWWFPQGKKLCKIYKQHDCKGESLTPIPDPGGFDFWDADFWDFGGVRSVLCWFTEDKSWVWKVDGGEGIWKAKDKGFGS
jgi:hypothetical protein